jgi:AcrR family transcriptional regulator
VETIGSTESRGAGRRERRKAATRASLVRAGRKLFSEDGIYEARVEDLAEHAEIGKGTLYLYFASKQDLAQAVVEAGFRDLEKCLSTAAASVLTFDALIDEIARAHGEFYEANPDLLRIFHQARGILMFQQPEWAGLRKPLERHVAHIATLLGRVPSPFRDRIAQRRAIALTLFGAISGACSVREALHTGPAGDVRKALIRGGAARLAAGLVWRGGRARRARARGRSS